MMDSKDAIDVLTVLSGKMHVAVASDIAELIQQQDKMIDLAIWHIKGCPFEICPHTSSECRDCWRKYLQGEVSK